MMLRAGYVLYFVDTPNIRNLSDTCHWTSDTFSTVRMCKVSTFKVTVASNPAQAAKPSEKIGRLKKSDFECDFNILMKYH